MAEEGDASAAAAAAAKVRVVRCPKCGKLLAELDGFKFYRCGGCNATLQAKRGTTDHSSDKTGDENMRISENAGVPSSKNENPSNASTETDQESLRSEVSTERTGDPNENPTITTDSTKPKDVSEQHDAQELDCSSSESRSGYRESSYRLPSKAPVNDLCSNVNEMAKLDTKEKRISQGEGYAFQTIQQTPISKGEDGDSILGVQKLPGTLSQESWLPPCCDEGPSNGRPCYISDHPDSIRVKYCKVDLSDRVEHLGQDRAELLKKLDELRDQLAKSCNVTDTMEDRVPVNKKVYTRNSCEPPGCSGLFHEGAPLLNRPSAGDFPLLHGYDMAMPTYHPTLHAQDEMLGYAGRFGSRLLGRTPCETENLFRQRPYSNFAYGQFDTDHPLSYPRDVLYHQPACSCLDCYNKHWQVPPQVPPSAFRNRRSPYLANSHGLYPVSNAAIFGSGTCNHRSTHSSLLSYHQQNHERSILRKPDVRGCRPLAGGAPFIVCYNCSELLQVPHKYLLRDKDRHKLCCGSCSEVISFEVNGKELVVSMPEPTIGTTLEPNGRAVDGMADGLQFHIPINDSCSVDSDSSRVITQSAEEKLVLLSAPSLHDDGDKKIERDYSLKDMEGLLSSFNASKDEKGPDVMIYQRDVPRSAELLQRSEVNLNVPGLPPSEQFGYPSSNRVLSRSETGSSKRSEKEKVICMNGNFEKFVKDEEMVAEFDLLVDDSLNTVLPEDFGEAGNEQDQPRMSKAGDSFFAGLMKKSFRDFSRSSQPWENGKFKVSINGHPIPDRLVKRAEKKAGPVQPGEYWYDYRAGFWGVMGQPCLGIIPPFIEEFNYPMPKGCAGGNTGVLVNGRELHQKDLDLLAGRGLPTSRDSSFIIEISGRVLDAISGEELDNLGKLAPTVEKIKHGFGMHNPQVSVV